MTLKNFYNHKYTKNILKHNTWIIWMSLLLNGLCTVLPMLLVVSQSPRNGSDYGGEYLLISNVFLYIVAIAGAKITGVGMFKYLNNKPEVDFYHGLPIKKNALFCSRYMVGVTAYLTGLKLMYFTAAIIALALGIIDFAMIPSMFISLVSVILTFLGVYSFVVLGAVVTGNVFMTIATAFGIMFSPIIFAVIVTNLCDLYYDTFAVSGFYFLDKIFKWTNPCFTGLAPILGYGATTTVGILPMIFIWLIVSYIAFISYMKRSMESAGEAVALSAFKPIIKGLGVIGASLLSGFLLAYGNEIEFYIISFVMGFIFHVAFEMLFGGDVKLGLKNIKHYPFYYAVVCLVFLVISLDLTGFDKRIEAYDDIKSITYNGVVLENSENLEILYSWIEEAVAREGNSINLGDTDVYMNTEQESGYDYESLQLNATANIYETVEITLKNGKSYVRNYGFRNIAISELEKIETSEEYLRNVLVYKLSEEILESIKDGSNSRPWVDLNNSAMELSVNKFLQIYDILLEQEELLSPEYINENTPVLVIRIFINENRESRFLYVYDIHKEVIEILEIQATEINDNMNLVVGDNYKNTFLDVVESADLSWKNHESELAGYSIEWTEEQLKSLREKSKPIYGNCSFYGNYNQTHKPLVFIEQDNSSYTAYISLEKLEEIFLNK